MTAMTARTRRRRNAQVATGVASCAMLLPAGCRKPTAELSVHPDAVEPVADAALPVCEQPAQAAAPPRPKPGSSDDRDPPVILGANFVALDRVQLTFSEGLAPVDQVNPRQFRLSMAYSSIDYQAGYASGYYYDVAGADNYEPPVVVTSLQSYEGRPEVLALSLSRPVPLELCVDMREMQADRSEDLNARMGLFLHYTSRGSVGIRDQADNPMADMGGEWALHFGARHRTLYGTEPVMRLDLLVELACPDETMTVSAPPGPI